MKIYRYDTSYETQWNLFLAETRNASFLFHRGYMDYHRDRFEDHSLLVLNDKDQLVAVAPGNRTGEEWVSHGGLTYGGVLSGSALTTPCMVRLFDELLTYLKGNGFTRLTYKTIPHIYHRAPAEEDRYALFLADAKLIRRDIFSVVAQPHFTPVQERRKRGMKKAAKQGVTVERSIDLATYWAILTETLQDTHGVNPVHSLKEITLLRDRFPNNIHLYTATKDSQMVAGVLVYETDRVARSQYIAANPQGRACSALDAVFGYLLNNVCADKPFFDFGPSNEDAGRVLNQGLVEQKEGFGARSVAHDFYEVDLGAYTPGSLEKTLK